MRILLRKCVETGVSITLIQSVSNDWLLFFQNDMLFAILIR